MGMDGRVVLVTGGNSGVGQAAATALAAMGADVTIAARNQAKAEAARDEIRAATGKDVAIVALDLASFDSVRACAKEYSAAHARLDVLVNNAGIVVRKRQQTVDGHELQLQVNHLGHFLLTNELMPLLEASGNARVVATASDAHRTTRKGLRFDDLEWSQRRYRAFSVYSATKMMNIMHIRELARRVDDKGITANAVHPGWVYTGFARDGDTGRLGQYATSLGRPFARTPEEGARTTVHVASAPELEGVTGQYFYSERLHEPNAAARDDAAAARLWEISEQLTT